MPVSTVGCTSNSMVPIPLTVQLGSTSVAQSPWHCALAIQSTTDNAITRKLSASVKRLSPKDRLFGEWSNNNIVGVKPTKYFLDVFFQYQEQFFKSKTNLWIRSKHLIELKPLYSIHWTRSDALGDKVILHLKCGNTPKTWWTPSLLEVCAIGWAFNCWTHHSIDMVRENASPFQSIVSLCHRMLADGETDNHCKTS